MSKEVYQLQLLAQDVVGVPACQPQGLHSSVKAVLPYSAMERTTVLGTARDRAAPAGMLGRAVKSRPVSSKQASSWRLSRRPAISSMGDWLGVMRLGSLARHLALSTFCLAPFAGARLWVPTLCASFLFSTPLQDRAHDFQLEVS